jgi:hypothetical protein
MSEKLKKHMTKGGPGDKFLGDGKVDTSQWFKNSDILENQIKNEEIWFCSAPFQLMYTNTKGDSYPCSWAENLETTHSKVNQLPNQFPSVRNTLPGEYFHKNNILRSLRTEMLTPGSDLKVVEKVCKNCRHQEKHYGRSRRQASLKIQTNDTELWPRIRNMAESFKKNGNIELKERLLEVQVKAFGNQCNLDCYMCVPYDSSTRIQTMNSPALAGADIFSEQSIKKPKLIDKQTLDSVIDDIVTLSPYIYNLKLIGGEPLVMKKFYTLLSKIIHKDEARAMMIKYQTNMSVLEFEKIKITKFIPHFHLFEFTVSLDGIEKENNYIRRRSNWEEIIRNMEHVSFYPNVEININGTISFLSVLRFYRLINWAKENGDLIKQINWSNIRGPAKLCANVLPQKLKDKLIPMYEGFPDIQNVLKEDNHGHHYQETLDYLFMIDKHYKGTKWEMNLFDVYPELEEFYKPHIQEIEL